MVAFYEELRSREETFLGLREVMELLWIEGILMVVLSSVRKTAGVSGTHMTSSPTSAT